MAHEKELQIGGDTIVRNKSFDEPDNRSNWARPVNVENVTLRQGKKGDMITMQIGDEYERIRNFVAYQGDGADTAMISVDVLSDYEHRVMPDRMSGIVLNGGANYDDINFSLFSLDATITHNKNGSFTFRAPSQGISDVTFSEYEMAHFQVMASGNMGYDLTAKDLEVATQRTPTVNLQDILRGRSPSKS